MLISIAIRTYSNARKLTVALESLRALTSPEALQHEILTAGRRLYESVRRIGG